MDKVAFDNAINNWVVDFRASCADLFSDGVHPMHVMKIAMQIADSKAERRAAERQVLSVPPGARVPSRERPS
jgi:hypothetical protein